MDHRKKQSQRKTGTVNQSDGTLIPHGYKKAHPFSLPFAQVRKMVKGQDDDNDLIFKELPATAFVSVPFIRPQNTFIKKNRQI